jgi:hypothetical protein
MIHVASVETVKFYIYRIFKSKLIQKIPRTKDSQAFLQMGVILFYYCVNTGVFVLLGR